MSMSPPRNAKPWIERVVANPALRSGYASLVAHVIVCLVLALLALVLVMRYRPEGLVPSRRVAAELHEAHP